ncbi:hypothetical protein ACJRO7_028510 [Eucalyptus globulus]|uniref:Uncharacterized protein n=1 Tax=Eucalyptus globulus TaxID=34317 RepID=A0ABD3JZQ6_EUCGL
MPTSQNLRIPADNQKRARARDQDQAIESNHRTKNSELPALEISRNHDADNAKLDDDDDASEIARADDRTTCRYPSDGCRAERRGGDDARSESRNDGMRTIAKNQ